jgi:hypothetical protein
MTTPLAQNISDSEWQMSEALPIKLPMKFSVAGS